MTPIFEGEKIFFKIGESSLLRYPVGQKCHTVKEIQAVLCFNPSENFLCLINHL